MALTNFTDQKLLQLLFGNVSYSAPATLYFGVSTTTPTAAGANFTEPSGNAYARVALANGAATTNWHAATSQPGSGFQQNTNATVTFPTATGAAASWGTVTYLGIFDASSAGNLLWFGALTVAQTIGGGDTLSFAADGVQITNA